MFSVGWQAVHSTTSGGEELRWSPSHSNLYTMQQHPPSPTNLHSTSQLFALCWYGPTPPLYTSRNSTYIAGPSHHLRNPITLSSTHYLRSSNHTHLCVRPTAAQFPLSEGSTRTPCCPLTLTLSTANKDT
jgi:hypothetical protein